MAVCERDYMQREPYLIGYARVALPTPSTPYLPRRAIGNEALSGLSIVISALGDLGRCRWRVLQSSKHYQL